MNTRLDFFSGMLGWLERDVSPRARHTRARPRPGAPLRPARRTPRPDDRGFDRALRRVGDHHRRHGEEPLEGGAPVRCRRHFANGSERNLCASCTQSFLDEALLLGEPAEDTHRCGRTRFGPFGEGLHRLGFHKSASTINVEENAEACDEMNHARDRHVFVAVLQMLSPLRRRFYPDDSKTATKVRLSSAKRSGSHRAWSLARADYPP
jgi:hypothetical protein